MEKLIEALKSIGGNEWKTEKAHRFYFNDFANRLRKNGHEISNGDARYLMTDGKIYYDVLDGSFNASISSAFSKSKKDDLISYLSKLQKIVKKELNDIIEQ